MVAIVNAMGSSQSSLKREYKTAKRELASDRSKSNSIGLTEEQRSRVFGAPPQAAQSEPTREQKADAEFEAWVDSLSSNTTATPSSGDYTGDYNAPDPKHDPRISPVHEDGTANISPYYIHPTSMDCTQEFNQAMLCKSLGGKFQGLYRYGKVQDCSENWSSFAFCMRTRMYGKEDKAHAMRKFYEAREKARGKRSETVWEIREKPVTEAFGRDMDED